jgi:hypothetical protein
MRRKRLFSLLPYRKPVWKPALRQAPHSFVAGREGRRRWLASHCLRGRAALNCRTVGELPALAEVADSIVAAAVYTGFQPDEE